MTDPQLQQRRQPLPPGMHVYYATCHPGLEEVVAAELRSANIGAVDVQPGGLLAARPASLAAAARSCRGTTPWHARA